MLWTCVTYAQVNQKKNMLIVLSLDMKLHGIVPVGEQAWVGG
jgi:hypothetical protein